MKRTVQITADGSPTIAIPEMQVTYHSKHGAIQESLHVFIEAGLKPALEKFDGDIRVFEMGFGTGLNAFLTLQQATTRGRKMVYYSVEQFPLQRDEYTLLDYGNKPLLLELHSAPWNEDVAITEDFMIHKAHTSLQSLQTTTEFHLLYYDAFAPKAQPGLWTEDIFRKIFAMMYPDGILVTYCSKSDVRRAMQSAGFIVEKIPGPPGKREMLRAIRPHV